MAKKAMQSKPSFHQHLILNRWLLSLFGQENLKLFKERLDDDRFLGLADDGQSKFFEQLNNRAFLTECLNEQDLRRYDLNIVQHWQKITEKRNHIEGHTLEMKYFQYLSLLFTEIYLDWYFNRRDALLTALNEELSDLNEELKAYQTANQKTNRKEDKPYGFLPYQASDLNKIAFWNATGSGKTLLMHVNILQYQQYAQGGYDKIIVLTPNEGLSQQHVSELELSGFSASLFDKNSGELFREKIEIIDVNKLADKHGDKTVAVEAFAGNNLVLVDEGHRGTSGTEWMARREKLIDQGFAFEYSATFGQAVASNKGSKTVQEQMLEIQKSRAKKLFNIKNLRSLNQLSEEQLRQSMLSNLEHQQARQTAMLEVYAKAVLFDYSYKFFYEDGYGKESLILNLRDEYYEQHHQLYLTACLLSFYQQLYLFETHQSRLEAWNIEKPLWVFVGNTVSKEDSDIQKILQFLAFFLNNPSQIQSWLADLLADNTRLTDKNGNNIFRQRFTPLMDFCGEEQALYDDMLKRLFNASSRGRLTLTHLKKADGELSLSVGNYPAFGVINVGDAAGFYKTAESEKDFDSTTDDFSDGLFQRINHHDSQINLLIGSKKFTEGWSSWRVSTMGLMNMGTSEGSQIIQLFGRGVRLKGYGFSLKRSLPEERPKGVHLEKLETLNIFGINAGYMEQFKDYLRKEGITPPDEILTIDFKVQPNLPQNVKLKTLRLKDGYKDNQKLGFKRQENVTLYDIPEKYQGKIKVIEAVLDCYPQIEAIDSQKKSTTPINQREKNRLEISLFDLFDWDAIYLQLLDYKLKRTWSNLALNKQRLRQFAQKNDWYTLYIPASALTVKQFADVLYQQSLLIQLLCLYTDAFYQRLKAAYEGQFYETAWIDEKNGSMQDGYQFKIENIDDGKKYRDKLQQLKAFIDNAQFVKAQQWQASNIAAICFEPHLYYPIMTIVKDDSLPVKMQPLAMNEDSEIRFVHDLQQAYNSGKLQEWIGDKDIYLLRNAANKAKGLGFALAGNFYPDFLLWLVDKQTNQQWLTFIDPKGIRQMGINDPKFGLADEIKKLEKECAIDITLNSFILSITNKKDAPHLQNVPDEELKRKHILFMEDKNYLKQLFMMLLS